MALNLFEQALAAEGIKGDLANLARSVFQQETSSGKNVRTSGAGARGHMQIMPATFASVADKDWVIDNPEHNIRAGLRYLGQMYQKAGGDPLLAAAGYYSGPGGMDKARRGVAVGDPRNPNAPTQLAYAQQVVGRLGQGMPAPTQPAPVVTAPVEPVRDVPLPAPAPQLAQGSAPAGFVSPYDGWEAMKQAMPSPVTSEALDFKPVNVPGMVSPLAYANNPNVTLKPLKAMKGLKGRVMNG